jgi:hypothetical protein
MTRTKRPADRISTRLHPNHLSRPAGIAFISRHGDDVRRAWLNELNPVWLMRLVTSFDPGLEKLRPMYFEIRDRGSVPLGRLGESSVLPASPERRAVWFDYCEIIRRHFPIAALLRLADPPS